MPRWLPWLALAVLAVLPYLGGIGYPLLHDDRTLLDNRWLREDAGPVSVLRHDFWYGTRHEGSDLYRPIPVLTLAWNLRTATSSIGFRGTNLALHALVTLSVAWMLCGVLASRRAAWIGAAIFAVHPLASEAVMWATGRAELLAALFGVVGFRLFVDAERRDRAGARLAVSLAMFLLALLSKESAASWIAIGTVFWIVDGPRNRPRRSLLGGTAYLAVLASYLLLRGGAVGWALSPPHWVDNPLVAEGLLTRWCNAIVLQVAYLAKMVAPFRLSIDYGYDQIPVRPLSPWGAVAAAIVIAAWSGGLLALRRVSRAAAFLWIFIPAAFAVTANAVVPIGVIFAERLAYLPLVGACGLAGLAIDAVPKRRAGMVAAGVVLLLAGARTAWRTTDYESADALRVASVAASPRAVKSLTNLGRSRLRQRELAEAEDLLTRAVTIWPEYPRALSLLADVYDATGRGDLAREYRRRAEISREAGTSAP